MIKQCSKCGEFLPLSDYYRQPRNKDGLWTYCRACANKQRKKYIQENKSIIYEKQRAYRKNNSEKFSGYSRDWRKRNPEKANTACREWRERNHNSVIDRSRKYYQDNKEKEGNRTRKYFKWAYKNRPEFKLRHRISCGIRKSLKKDKDNRKWQTLVGYTVRDLKKHLEKLFKNGMTWENYGEWEIDHIVPVSVFNFSDIKHDDFKRCWGLSNLQPLWATENRLKSNKTNVPFQPRLAMG